jgi:alpha-beta hydrolase superfamily lysophospholipase
MSAGLVVVTYDWRGHGLSGVVDGRPGYCSKFRDHVEDLLAVLQHAQDRHVGLPCFLFAESSGGVQCMLLPLPAPL